jgi:hypothetical protein
MTTLKKQLFFGEDSENKDYHTHKVFVNEDSVIISSADEYDEFSFFVKISFEEWNDIIEFVNQETN